MIPLKKSSTVLITAIMNNDVSDLPTRIYRCNRCFHLRNQDCWGFL